MLAPSLSRGAEAILWSRFLRLLPAAMSGRVRVTNLPNLPHPAGIHFIARTLGAPATPKAQDSYSLPSIVTPVHDAGLNND
jgi:hypothetical protein